MRDTVREAMRNIEMLTDKELISELAIIGQPFVGINWDDDNRISMMNALLRYECGEVRDDEGWDA